jgi:hypothetical protein
LLIDPDFETLPTGRYYYGCNVVALPFTFIARIRRPTTIPGTGKNNRIDEERL